MKEEKPTVTARQKYTIEVVHYSDGSTTMNRNNNGFSAMDLLGLMTMVQHDVVKVVGDYMVPKVTRTKRGAKDCVLITTPKK